MAQGALQNCSEISRRTLPLTFRSVLLPGGAAKLEVVV